MSKIIGISAGRKNKISDKSIKLILDNVNKETVFYSISDFEILTCDACLGCANTNICIKNDKLNIIKKKMIESEIIIFAGPEYWDGANAKTRAFWERICFSGRHNSLFPLKDKLGIIIGVSGDGNSQKVIGDISRFMEDAKINVIEKISIQGEYACFKCGYCENCEVGGVYELYPSNPKINKEKIPSIDNQHPENANWEENVRNELTKIAYSINNRLSKENN